MDKTGTDMETEIDIASQMGFASFGAQPTPKKRRYNPAADAVISGPTSLLPKPPTTNAGGRGSRKAVYSKTGATGNGSGSGSNCTGLRIRRTNDASELGTQQQQEENSAINGGVTMKGAPRNFSKTVDSYGEIGYAESTSLPASDQASATIAGLADLGAESEESHKIAGQEAMSQSMGERMTNRLTGGDNGALILPGQGRKADGGKHEYEWATLRRGVRNEMGDMVYYDESFIEDPWTDLEASRRKGG